VGPLFYAKIIITAFNSFAPYNAVEALIFVENKNFINNVVVN